MAGRPFHERIVPVSEEAQQRVARNEALIRETNEAIERGQWPGEPEKVLRFRCECARIDCGEAIELTRLAYERIRQFPRRFIVVEGHVEPTVEDVVARVGRYLVVEKRGAGGELAEATDPRA
jgi:hypothetical protein